MREVEIRSARGGGGGGGGEGGGKKLTALSFVLFFYCFTFLMERRKAICIAREGEIGGKGKRSQIEPNCERK